MNEEENIEELKRLLYTDTLTQCGKRRLINYYEKQIEKLQKENKYKAEKIENQKNELAILNEKQKDFNKLQNTLNSYKGQFRRQEKEKKEYLKAIDTLNKEKEDWIKAYQEEKDKQFEIIRKNRELEKRWNNDTHKLQNDLDIANAKIIELEKKIEDLKDFRKKFVDITDKELKEADDYFMYKYTFMGDELAQHLNTLLKVANNSIPVQKVKDKIKKLRNNPLKINENNRYYYETDAYNKIIIQVLQELIEEREEKQK